jgi:hypothetical protein
MNELKSSGQRFGTFAISYAYDTSHQKYMLFMGSNDSSVGLNIYNLEQSISITNPFGQNIDFSKYWITINGDNSKKLNLA